MSKAASAEVVVSPLLWLNQLQDKDSVQVGGQLLHLSQLLKSDYPVCPGFVIPDPVMQEVWTQVAWSDEILQDFPYLRLNFSLSQAIQLQSMAQALQSGILDLALSAEWAAIWHSGLSQCHGQQLVLTPYLWTSQDHSDAGNLPFLQPIHCDIQIESLWDSLKSLWSALFQAGHLYVLQHLGLPIDQIHLSVLVQPISEVYRSGWLKLTTNHILIEAVQGTEHRVWQGAQWPECYIYDRLTQQTIRCAQPFSQKQDAQPSLTHALPCQILPSDCQTAWLSEPALRSMVELGHTLNPQTLSSALTVAWIWSGSSDHPLLQILGIVPDLPLPILGAAGVRSSRIAPPYPHSPNPLMLLGLGLAASPGYLTAPVVVVNHFQQIAPDALRDSILVAHHLDPIHLPWLKEAAGLVCETGGVTSHGAIIAREYGCPAVVGVQGILKTLQTGQWVVLNGDLGEIYGWTGPEICSKDTCPTPLNRPAPALAQPPIPLTSTSVMINLSRPALLEHIQLLDTDGVGLIRGEWLLLDQLPYRTDQSFWIDSEQLKQRLQGALEKIIQAFAPHPIFYRAVDFYPSDWQLLRPDWQTIDPGRNPALGFRGTLWMCQDARLFELELEVLKALLEKGAENLRLILPFVRSPQEAQFCIQTLQTSGLTPQCLPVWMMAEVPSVLFQLDQYAQMGIQGIAIGMNDLAQLLLGVDRDHAAFPSILAKNQTAIMAITTQLVQRAADLKLRSVLYGSLEQYPSEWLDLLLESGLTGVSVGMNGVTAARRAIAQAEQRLQIKRTQGA